MKPLLKQKLKEQLQRTRQTERNKESRTLGLEATEENCVDYATPKVTKYQRCNFIIQIHQFTIKIDKININLLFECVKIVEFNFNSHVFHVIYQETRFL